MIARWRRLRGTHLRTAVSAGLGAAAGAAYAHFVGCKTGTCPITSSVWTASLYGAAVGALAGWPPRVDPDQAGGGAGERG